jgi:hypothetical protein
MYYAGWSKPEKGLTGLKLNVNSGPPLLSGNESLLGILIPHNSGEPTIHLDSLTLKQIHTLTTHYKNSSQNNLHSIRETTTHKRLKDKVKTAGYRESRIRLY